MTKYKTILLIGLSVVGCGKDDKGGGGSKPGGSPAAPAGGGGTAAASGGATDCLVGSWVTEFGDKNVYTFNADKSGSRVYKEEAPTAFTWSLTDGNKGKVDFPAHGDTAAATFKFEVKCDQNKFFLEGASFKKQ
jgi:hypothetical protein